MPYSIRKDGQGWRIYNLKRQQALPPHYKSKKSAEKVVRYLMAKEARK